MVGTGRRGEKGEGGASVVGRFFQIWEPKGEGGGGKGGCTGRFYNFNYV